MGVNEEQQMGETVSAILRNATTGEKRVIDRSSKKDKYKIEVKVTDLRTGEIHRYEATR